MRKRWRERRSARARFGPRGLSETYDLARSNRPSIYIPRKSLVKLYTLR